jgi:hypothetical protein
MVDEDDVTNKYALPVSVPDGVGPARSGVSPEDGVVKQGDVAHWRKLERARRLAPAHVKKTPTALQSGWTWRLAIYPGAS